MREISPIVQSPQWYDSISLYDPDRPPSEIDLSDNTNLWGSPPTATALVHGAASQLLTRYPTPYTQRLKAAIARYCDVTPEWIVPGCGSDDVLDATFRTFSRASDPVAYVDPGFAFIPTLTAVLGLDADAVPLTPQLDIDSAALLGRAYRVIYIPAPNNPTGTEASLGALRALCEDARGMIVIDQAYAEFSNIHDEVFQLVREFPDRVIIVRTLSKAFGLAGFRVGYVVAHPDVAKDIQKTRGPYKVGMLAEQVAITALESDLDWVHEMIRCTVTEREYLTSGLCSLGLLPISSATNFVLVPIDEPKAVTVGLRQYGVSVRAFTSLPRVGDAIRITVGPRRMMSRCLTALGEILSCA
jgi:histidinol-phosphate aminotransferase